MSLLVEDRLFPTDPPETRRTPDSPRLERPSRSKEGPTSLVGPSWDCRGRDLPLVGGVTRGRDSPEGSEDWGASLTTHITHVPVEGCHCSPWTRVDGGSGPVVNPFRPSHRNSSALEAKTGVRGSGCGPRRDTQDSGPGSRTPDLPWKGPADGCLQTPEPGGQNPSEPHVLSP